MNDSFRNVARAVDRFTASPAATGIAFGMVLLWGVLGPRFRYSDTWQLVMNTTSSIVTFLMVFLIANAQKRDTEALHLKLDMLIAAEPSLSNKAVGLESASEAQAHEVRQELKQTIAGSDGL